MTTSAKVAYLLAKSRGVEPHPISENPVFKAGRRTNPAALLSKLLWFRGFTGPGPYSTATAPFGVVFPL